MVTQGRDMSWLLLRSPRIGVFESVELYLGKGVTMVETLGKTAQTLFKPSKIHCCLSWLSYTQEMILKLQAT